VAGLISTGINEHFESIFEVGVDEMSWDDLSKNDAEWPSVRAVNEYRRQAFALVKAAILTHPSLEPERLPVTQHSPAWALFMALEHEKIHIVRVPYPIPAPRWLRLSVACHHPRLPSSRGVAAGGLLRSVSVGWRTDVEEVHTRACTSCADSFLSAFLCGEGGGLDADVGGEQKPGIWGKWIAGDVFRADA